MIEIAFRDIGIHAHFYVTDQTGNATERTKNIRKDIGS
jgi:hypothetical protein